MRKWAEKTLHTYDMILGAVLCLLTVITIWQVFTRYILNSPSLYTEEVLKYGMIWLAMFGAAMGFLRNEHLAFTLIINKLPSKSKKTLQVINNIVIACFFVLVFILGGRKFIERGASEISPILQIKMSYIYGIMPVVGVIAVLALVLRSIALIKNKEDAYGA